MKKFMSRVQDLNEKAAQIRAALERAPAQVQDIRQQFASAAGQIQQLRTDVESSVSDLRTSDETDLVAALTELHDGMDILAEAGYALHGVEMELSPLRRIIVHLRKFEEVPDASLHFLLTSVASRKTIHAVLASLIKAENLADRISLARMTYTELTIYVGPVPTVRLCWRADDAVKMSEATPLIPLAATPLAASVATAPPPLPAFGADSFFERRTPSTAPAGAGESEISHSVPADPAAPASEDTLAPTRMAPGSVRSNPAAWSASALDRFKKMPRVDGGE